ncbi:hypothetical protein AAMO2058_001741600 [Amorphochlora amoebiformis]
MADIRGDDIANEIDGLLRQYFQLYGELLAYMGQVEKHMRKGYAKFILARNQDDMLVLGTGSYAGREFEPFRCVEEGTSLRVKRCSPIGGEKSKRDKEDIGTKLVKNKGRSTGGKMSAVQLLRRRALAKAAERDPRLAKQLEEKEKEDKEGKKDEKEKESRDEEEGKKKNRGKHKKEEEIQNRNVKSEDPISWFGCLIPREARQGQSAFVAGLEKLVRIAEIKRTLYKLERNIMVKKGLRARQGS